ncbi:MAG: lipid-A-disaccharide synthase [Cyclobacteriaceae bacterium]|nr:lipid-A-disaccharide synthase [Cyclobacteriaceae bacterium]
MKLYFVAGERSGDLHGGNLIKYLRASRPDCQLRGFGGDFMQQAGMELVVHYRELAFMGFGEVIRHLGKIHRNLNLCKTDILSFRPDAVVLIDFAGFNLRVAQFAKKNGISVLWYIAPKVWAWNTGRVKKMKKWIDRLFVILPFEREFFKRYNWTVDYVGNPVLDAIKNFQFDEQFGARYNLPDVTVAMLPGSRRQEVKRMSLVFKQVARQFPDVVFIIPMVNNLKMEYYHELRAEPNIRVLSAPAYDILKNARAAIVTSGTATLETALLRIPQVVVYRTSSFSYFIGRALIKVPFISLVNLIAGRKVVEELIQQDADVKKISEVLRELLHNEALRKEVLKGYEEIYRLLDTGSASARTAELIINFFEERGMLNAQNT